MHFHPSIAANSVFTVSDMTVYNGDILTIETNSTLSPTNNGNYAVEITEGNCIDTSACQIVNSVSLSEEMLLSTIEFYPNPSNGFFNMKLPSDQTSIQIEVSDLIGNILIHEGRLLDDSNGIDLSTFPNGIYMVRLRVDTATKIVRLIKE